MKILKIGASALLLLIILLVFFPPSNSTKKYDKLYESLENGMSYTEVKSMCANVFNYDGFLYSELTIEGTVHTTHLYKDHKKTIILTFKDHKLTDKLLKDS